MQSQAGITSNERDCTLGGGGGVILGRPQHFGVGNLCCHVLLIKKRNVAFEKRKNEKEHPVLPTKPYKGPGAGGGAGAWEPFLQSSLGVHFGHLIVPVPSNPAITLLGMEKNRPKCRRCPHTRSSGHLRRKLFQGSFPLSSALFLST